MMDAEQKRKKFRRKKTPVPMMTDAEAVAILFGTPQTIMQRTLQELKSFLKILRTIEQNIDSQAFSFQNLAFPSTLVI